MRGDLERRAHLISSGEATARVYNTVRFVSLPSPTVNSGSWKRGSFVGVLTSPL